MLRDVSKKDECVKRNMFGSPLPLTGSHEAAGIVSKLGTNVEGFSIGQRVGGLLYRQPCGQSCFNTKKFSTCHI